MVQWFILMSQLVILLLDKVDAGQLWVHSVLCYDDLFLDSMHPLHALECLSLSCFAIRLVSLKTVVTISAFSVWRFRVKIIHVSFALAVRADLGWQQCQHENVHCAKETIVKLCWFFKRVSFLSHLDFARVMHPCILSFLISNFKDFLKHFLDLEACDFVEHCRKTCKLFFFFKGFNRQPIETDG